MAAGVNPVDTKLRSRGPLIPDGLPMVLGCDGAGVVEAVGAEVSGLAPGDAVWLCHGGLGGPVGNYAEYIVAEAAGVRLKPKTLSFVEAAAAPLVLITAWEALFDRAGLKAGPDGADPRRGRRGRACRHSTRPARRGSGGGHRQRPGEGQLRP